MIQNPNSSGQGHDPDYAANPYHETIKAAGFEYSHSTPVHYRDGASIHHTYKRGPRNVTVWRRNEEWLGSVWRWEASVRSGSSVCDLSISSLRRYLKNAARHLKDERRLHAVITRHLAVPSSVAPHGRCDDVRGCIEPVPDEEKCR